MLTLTLTLTVPVPMLLMLMLMLMRLKFSDHLYSTMVAAVTVGIRLSMIVLIQPWSSGVSREALVSSKMSVR